MLLTHIVKHALIHFGWILRDVHGFLAVDHQISLQILIIHFSLLNWRHVSCVIGSLRVTSSVVATGDQLLSVRCLLLLFATDANGISGSLKAVLLFLSLF